MNRLDARFAELKSRGEGALVAFVTAGDPFPSRTADVICALAEAGADVIELGVPFSDPLADGPTIQAASFRALQGGMTPPKVLDAVREARARGVAVPIVLMGAYNPVLQYGPIQFAQDAVAAGADGAIVTDVIPEEADTWKPIADATILPAFLRVAQPLPKGQCTWYAFGRAAEAGWKIRFDVNSGRHGRNWWDKVTNAKKSDTPSVGAVLVLDAWPGNEYGHVAYVEKVNSNDSFEITHANFAAGEPVAQREGITIYRAACTKSAEGISIAGGPVLPLRGFLVPIE